MKKIAILLSALSLLAFVSCEENGNNGDTPNWDEIVEDGFYVAGPATGATELEAKYMMNAGFNEATKSNRDGMYEKYIYLEKDQDFELLLYAGKQGTRYSAVLSDFAGIDGQDEIFIKRGELKTGTAAPAMTVAESGIYHIVLDLNLKGDLKFPQIVLAPVNWGVRGGGKVDGTGSDWSNTIYGTSTEYKDGKMTFTVPVRLVESKSFKFVHCDGWKVFLDDAKKVSAETSLAVKDGLLGYYEEGVNIDVEKTGNYEVAITYELKPGALGNSFSYEAKLTKAIEVKVETFYLTGSEFGNWFDASKLDEVVELVPVHSEPGYYWTIRYFSAGSEFKVAPQKAWGNDFGMNGGNAKIEEAGLYIVYVNGNKQSMVVEPATIYGIGNAFGSWDEGQNAFTIAADGKATVSVKNTVDGQDGNAPTNGGVRMYAGFSGADVGTWWHREFIVRDGKIEYRGKGDDQKPWVAVNAGQTVTLDFNAGTGSIQ